MIEDSEKQEVLARLRLYRKSVREVLLCEWDPIGITPHNEYDSYVDRVCSLLMRHPDREQLAAFLWQAESEIIGMPGTREGTQQIANRLLKIRDEIEGTSP